MYTLYFMIFLMVFTDGSIGTQAFVNESYVEKGTCEQYLPESTEIMKQHTPNLSKIQGWCVQEDWPFEPDAQPKGSI